MAYAAHQRMAAAAAALAAAPPGSAGGALPYVCNWVAGTATPFQSVSQIESNVRASMLNLTNSFSGQIRVLKTAQQSEKESGCAIPKENINRTSTNVDEEHFLVLC